MSELIYLNPSVQQDKDCAHSGHIAFKTDSET